MVDVAFCPYRAHQVVVWCSTGAVVFFAIVGINFAMDTLVAPKTLDELVSALHKELAGTEADVKRVKWLMESYQANPADYSQYVKWDTHRYTRTLVDRGNGKFNLIVLCWGEAQGSCIHAHSDSHCFMKILDGTLRESLYAWPESGKKCSQEQCLQEQCSQEQCSREQCRSMTPQEFNNYRTNQCAYINDSMGIHRVENPSHTRKAISLHLYSPPFDMCKTFDEHTGHERTCRMTFTGDCELRTVTQPSCRDS